MTRYLSAVRSSSTAGSVDQSIDANNKRAVERAVACAVRSALNFRFPCRRKESCWNFFRWLVKFDCPITAESWAAI